MIVVGIIGILVSLTGPQYNKYQRKARQAEAKIALAAIYGLEKSFYSEYSAYIPAFDAIGFSPEGSRRFYQMEPCTDPSSPWTGTVIGYAGAAGVNNYPAQNIPWTWTWNPVSPHPAMDQTLCTAYGNDPQTFSAHANGTLYNGAQSDVWDINDLKILVNCSTGT